MPPEFERQVDEIWNSFLDRISKKEPAHPRPGLGDDIDIFVPQIRELLLLSSNPAVPFVLYNSAYTSANRNAYVIMRKLGMPPDYFWKFEYWPRERSLETMRRVIGRVFTAMMTKNGEGTLELADVSMDKIRFFFSFKDCAECAGLEARSRICFYHAATFTGIIAALVNKELDGFETKCRANGAEACTFTVGLRNDPEIAAALKSYLETVDIKTVIETRLEKCLTDGACREPGNLVATGYYQLLMMNSLLSNPELFAASFFDAGVNSGRKLAPALARHYGSDDLTAIGKYYRQVRYLELNLETDEKGIRGVISECAELAGLSLAPEMLSFLFGELQGMVSWFLKTEFTYSGHEMTGNKLAVTFTPG